MIKPIKITIIIPAFNEERNIRDCLESAKWADEVFVVDSFSTDGTLEIARSFGARIVQHEYVNSAAQKNWAIPQATHPWVMILDADERIPVALRDEILEILSRDGGGCDGFRIYRINHFMGKQIRHCGWNRDHVLRLFRRDKGRYLDREVHADVVIDGRVRFLKNKLMHFTFASMEQFLKKMDRYTGWAAGDRGRHTKKVRWRHLALRPAFRFFRQYILQLGFLDGTEGLILCLLASYSVFLKYAKLYERLKNKP
ncbi:MAG TPA: glycosyltransferase family 2 protein [Candidatus Sumerlaeota bacterium]|nr:MAG: Glycosyl transferase family 2 [candidate division BRC1 bacterium ADurb.Bin183]HQH12068.1 glycosyltransferase family 2 protein [Candidatus Sumerlaeota bacterium]HRR32091.1 glycosyltransferase family 2 protein [Candidatus Sumerlaeia bacterium]HRS00294.1 glycosyltransferase family 2 protein [Candidatus Sumerlaeia bacterium]